MGALAAAGALVVAFTPGAASASAPAGQPVPHFNPIKVLRSLHVGPAGDVTSTNWSGYADTATSGATYTKVSANWTEPAVTCTSQQAITVFWVGIDGYTSGTVEQDGTLAWCSGGTATYYTWWEMYPSNPVQIVGSSVSPGDQISSSVVRSGSQYTLTVTDSTHTANSFSLKQSCSTCQNSSAEWIVERPSGSGGLYPLANFGTFTFTRSKVTGSSGKGNIATYPNDAITMVNGSGQQLATVSRLKHHGTKFVTTWHQSQ